MENKKIILVTEDEKSLRSALSLKLINEGFSVIEAKDGEEGLSKALSEHPDLMILDIVLPRMSGVEVLKELRKDTWGKTAQVMVLTNLSDPKTLAEIMEHEVFEYFVKTDIKIEEFIEKIKAKLALP